MTPDSFTSSHQLKAFTENLCAHSDNQSTPDFLQKCLATEWGFENTQSLFEFLDSHNNASARLSPCPVPHHITLHLFNRETASCDMKFFDTQEPLHNFYNIIKNNPNLFATKVFNNLLPAFEWFCNNTDINKFRALGNAKFISDALMCFLNDDHHLTTTPNGHYDPILILIMKLTEDKLTCDSLDTFCLTFLDDIKPDKHFEEQVKRFICYAMGYALLHTSKTNKTPTARDLNDYLVNHGADFYKYILDSRQAEQSIISFQQHHLANIENIRFGLEDDFKNLFRKTAGSQEKHAVTTAYKKRAAILYFQKIIGW